MSPGSNKDELAETQIARPDASGPRRTRWFGSRPGQQRWHRGLALVVADRDRDGLNLRDFLRERGFRTIVCVGGREALDAIEQEEPDLVLLDCWRHALDPLSVLSALAARPRIRGRCLVVRAPDLLPDSDVLVRRAGAAEILGRADVAGELAAFLRDPTDGGTPTEPEARVLERRPPRVTPEPAQRPVVVAPGLCIADRFVLERELGRGATAWVYLARDTELMDTVAIKIMMDTSKVRSVALRFRREARVCRALQHPSIVRLYEFGSWRGLLYLTMEYVPGRTMRQLLERSATGLSLRTVLGVARQSAAALAVAHSAGVAHRDIKPGNLMLLPSGGVKVMDFGLAKGPTSGLEGSDSRWVVGTPHYLAPERLKGAPEPCLSGDVWSLGVSLYEGLTGEAPFDAGDLSTLLDSILKQPVRPPRELRADIPVPLQEMILSMLQRDPAKRPSDLSALSQTFGQLQLSLHRSARSARIG